MGDSGFQVEPSVLDRYSSLLAEQAEQLRRIAEATAAITLSSDAFGHLPNAQHLASAFQEHAGTGRENVGLLGDALHGSAQGLSGVSRNYTDHEEYVAGTMSGGR